MKRSKRLLALLLCLCVVASVCTNASGAFRKRTFLVTQAQTLAVANSQDIKLKYNEVLLKQMKYVEAVDGIKAKVKNLRSFRWSPLLSFKFPQQLNMVELYDLNIKPLTLQAEIDTLKHEMRDLRHAAVAQATTAYVKVYISQVKMDFTQEKLDTAKTELVRNRARLLTGDADQADVDKMESSLEELTSELAGHKTNFETAKKELSDCTGRDVTSGWQFENPLKEMALPRAELESAVQYTLKNSHNYYEAKMAKSTAMMNLVGYESIMRNEYGDKMSYIQTYIRTAKQGGQVDYAAFQMDYKKMTKALDQPWNKKVRILFFTFTKEWFKGEISGTRFIEDEMYAVYTACMAYSNAEKERAAAEKALRKEVESTYEALNTAWRGYENLDRLAATAAQTLEKVLTLNKLGKNEYSQVKDAQKSYQDAQVELTDALSTYNEMLFNFDRLTCGYITQYLKGAGLGLEAGGTGDSYRKLDVINEPYYYIYTKVADLTFFVGVSIPEGFTPAITHFEVWNEGIQIGQRSQITEEIQHLTIDYGGTSQLLLKFFNEDEYVTECEVDATVPRDKLDIEADEPPPPAEEIIGSYTVNTRAVGELETSTLKLKLNKSVAATHWAIRYGDHGSVSSSEKKEIEQGLTYLTLLVASLEEVSLELYDENGGLLRTARFDPATQELLAWPEE